MSINEKAFDKQFNDTVQQHLDAHCEAIDAATASRLTQARYAALDASRQQTPLTRRLFATALASVAALALWLHLHSAPIPPAPVSAETFALLAAPDDGELIQSLDYYAFLLEQDDDE